MEIYAGVNVVSILVSSFIVMGLVLQFFMFFKSIRITFYVFLAVAAAQILALGKFWFDNYQSYHLLDGFVQPIVAQFGGPQPVSEGLVLQDIAWDGRHLTHTYLISSRENAPSFDVVRSLSCRGQARVNILALGAVLEHVYLVNGNQAASYRISLLTCFADE